MMCPLRSSEKNPTCTFSNCMWWLKDEHNCVIMEAYSKTNTVITMLQDYLSRHFQIKSALDSIIKRSEDGNIQG